MEKETKAKKTGKKFEINPEIPDNEIRTIRTEEAELDEANQVKMSNLKVGDTVKLHKRFGGKQGIVKAVRKDGADVHVHGTDSPTFAHQSNFTKIDVKEEAELKETLSLIGRLRAARNMKKREQLLQMQKRRKDLLSMTKKRADKLGWRGARQKIKQRLAKGMDFSSLSASAKSNIEKRADRLKKPQEILARKLSRQRLNNSYIDDAFEMMLEGSQRYHQLLNKDGGVKFDMRFKHFREKSNPYFQADNEDEIIDTVREMAESSTSVDLAAIKALEKLNEQCDDVVFNAHRVAKHFDIDKNDLLEIWNEVRKP